MARVPAKLHPSMRGWGLLLAVSDPKAFNKLLSDNMRRGLKDAGNQMVRFINSELRRPGAYEPNAPMTVAGKRSSGVLRDTGQLAGAITAVVRTPFLAEVGLIRQTAGEKYNIGRLLHDGFTVDLRKPQYAKMRRFLHARRNELIKQGRLNPNARSKSGRPGFLVVPPRPFIAKPFASPEAQKVVNASLRGAMDATMDAQRYVAARHRRPSA